MLPFSASIHGQTSASLGVAMDASVETQGDGSFTVTYTIRVTNLGASDLREVQIEDDLASALSEASAFEVVSVTSEGGTIRTGYDGRTVIGLLTGTDILARGQTASITLVVRLTPDEGQIAFDNSAVARALGADGTAVTDVSQQGNDPDLDADGSAFNDNEPTRIVLDATPSIGLAKSATVVPSADAGHYSVVYALSIANFGHVVLRNVNIQDSLAVAFPPPALARVVSLSSAELQVNSNYDGVSDVRLLGGADDLDLDEQGTLVLTLDVDPNGSSVWFRNRAMGSGEGPSGTVSVDFSQTGTNPDPDGDGDSTNNDAPTEVFLAQTTITGSAEATVRLSGDPMSIDISSILFDTTIKIDSMTATLSAKLTDTTFDLLSVTVSGMLIGASLNSSLVFNPTTVSFVSWRSSASVVPLSGVSLTSTLYVTTPQISSYSLWRATATLDTFALDVSAKFGVCPVEFWEASACADWTWPVCSIPLHACLAIDDTVGFVSFTASATSIPVLPGFLGDATLLDVLIKYATTEKTVTPTLRFQPQWFVCPEIRVFGEMVFSQDSLGIAGLSIYGIRAEVPIEHLIFRVADSLDPLKNSTLTGKAAYFELLEIESPLPSCCGTLGKVKVSTYFEHPQVPTATLFNVGLIVGYAEVQVVEHVRTAVSVEFSPSTTPLWLLTARLQVTW
jgi:uncharacterized repeat protein (TIGR01451 family)